MTHRFALLAGLCVTCLFAGVGCGPHAPTYAEPKGLAPEERAILSRPGRTTTYIAKIDGGVTPRPGPSFWADFHDERIVLRPGVHQVEVRYEDGNKFSLYNAEISFAAQPGHTYEINDWPPDLLDITQSRKNAQPVPHQVRVVKPE